MVYYFKGLEISRPSTWWMTKSLWRRVHCWFLFCSLLEISFCLLKYFKLCLKKLSVTKRIWVLQHIFRTIASFLIIFSRVQRLIRSRVSIQNVQLIRSRDKQDIRLAYLYPNYKLLYYAKKKSSWTRYVCVYVCVLTKNNTCQRILNRPSWISQYEYTRHLSDNVTDTSQIPSLIKNYKHSSNICISM